MKRELTREELKTLFLETIKEAGFDWEEIKARQAKYEEQQTNWFGRVVSGLSGRKEEEKKGLVVARVIRALASAKGDADRALEWAKKIWGAEDAAVKALSAGDAAAGGFLVRPEVSSEIIELLRPASVIRRLNPTVMPMDTGSLSVSKLTGGATAGYVGENGIIATTQLATGMLNLVWKKLAAIVPISNDLLRFASPQADQTVRDDLVAAMAQREDLAFIRGDGLSATPKGLRNWTPAANQLLVNATVNLANVTVDLGRLVVQLMQSDVRMLRPGWMMSPRTWNFLMTIRDGNGNFAFRPEMLGGTLWGWPFGVTTQIPNNLAVTGTNESEIYLVDFADAVIGESSEIIIDASPNAAYVDSATSQVVAAFSQDQTVVRAIARHDFGMRHDASVAVLTDVDWV